jgi:hypothetical protein
LVRLPKWLGGSTLAKKIEHLLTIIDLGVTLPVAWDGMANARVEVDAKVERRCQ